MASLPLWLLVLLILVAVGIAYRLGLRIGRAQKHQDREAEEILGRLEAVEHARCSAEQANQELRKALEELERLAGTDRLTGAWNRRRFEEGAQALMSLAVRKRDPLSLLFFDLDHFKRVNDQYGHAAGDRVLVAVVQAARTHLRGSDFLARWGGEEFVILASGAYLPGAAVLGEKVRASVESLDLGPIGPITISLGAAEFHPGESLEDWIQRADAALYHAKEGGRNRLEKAPRPEHLPMLAPPPLLHLVWDSSYASGHPIIDAQHQALFELADQVLSQPLSPAGHGVEDLQRLVAHVAQHFHDEETILRQAGFPGLRAHALEHAVLLSKARGLLDAAGKDDFPRLAGFLTKELIRDHIVESDRLYFSVVPGGSAS